MKKGSIFCLCFFLLVFGELLQSQNQSQEEKPWEWSLEQILSHVGKVRAGMDLTPGTWPNGARVAVALSFDFDSETNALRDNELSPGTFSQGEYSARVAIPRILALLEKYSLPASFFVPAISAILHKEEIAAILESGRHEIGLHGWVHERNSLLEEEEERRLMQQSYQTLEKLTGKAPVGIRTPSWDFSPSTLKIIIEMGLVYDSSLMADDRPYELLQDDRPTGIIELPVEWLLDDYPYFGFSRYSAVRPHIKPLDVLEIWASEFDKAYEEGTLFILTMHPKYIGHRSRMVLLEKLIQHILSYKDAWWATHEDIALFIRNEMNNTR